MIYINHIRAGISCRILLNEDNTQLVKQFFSMFHVTDYDIGLKSIGKFRINYRNNTFQLLLDDKHLVFDSIYECLLYVSDAIQHACTAEFVGYYHSSLCLNKRGKSILLIGASMAGKTSLNMFLCKNGFSYLSDDIAIINKNLKTVSMPIPVKIRHGIIYDDPTFNRYTLYKNNELKVLGSFNSKTTEATYDVAGVIFLNRGYDIRIEEMSPSELATGLIKNYFDIISMSTQIKFTSKLAAQVKGFRLFYNNLDDKLLKIVNAI